MDHCSNGDPMPLSLSIIGLDHPKVDQALFDGFDFVWIDIFSFCNSFFCSSGKIIPTPWRRLFPGMRHNCLRCGNIIPSYRASKWIDGFSFPVFNANKVLFDKSLDRFLYCFSASACSLTELRGRQPIFIFLPADGASNDDQKHFEFNFFQGL